MSLEEVKTLVLARGKTVFPAYLKLGYTDSDVTKYFVRFSTLYVLSGTADYLLASAELARIVTAYQDNLAALTNEEAVLAVDFVAKRYVKALEVEIARNKISTMYVQAANLEEEYQVKLAALYVDREVLNTLRTRIQIATERVEVNLKLLTTAVQEEIANLARVDIDLLEADIQIARKDIEILTTALKVLQVQLDVAEAALRLVELDAQEQGINADIAGIEVQIAEGSVLEQQLVIERAKNTLISYETNTEEAYKMESLQLSLDAAGDRLATAAQRLSLEASMNTKQLQVSSLETDATLADIAHQIAMLQQRLVALQIDLAGRVRDANTQNDARTVIAVQNTSLNRAQEQASAARKQAAINAATALAKASITSTLTHEIGSA